MTENGSRTPPRAGRRTWSLGLRPWVVAATYIDAASALLCLILIRWVGEAWWGVTPLLFSPRWLLLVPPLVLALLAVWVRKPSLCLVLGATALVIAGPLMVLTVPLAKLRGPHIEGERFRVLTYNLGDHPFDARGLTDLLERERIDLVCFQEAPRDDPALESFFARGWYRDRLKFVASRHPIVREMEPLPEDFRSEQRYAAKLHGAFIRAPSGREFLLASLHMPTLRPGLNRLLAGNIHGLQIHIDWWRRELDRVLTWLDRAHDTPLVLAGDFNMPPDDSTMASLRTAYRFAFEDAGWGYGYTRPSRTPWFRIDHIATSPEWDIARCHVGPDFGSDHLPLIAEVVLPLAPGR
ncbi:MAG: endonuclease/exonuclease/phosphatase family protein [Isosphaeraceae bacterium]|nr:endonuclease/exonuclease/phosphatase family protein [Isosphaeraceae bacterium]